MLRKAVLTGLASVLAGTLMAGPVFAQSDYPNKPVTFVVPTKAGGGSDTMARIVGDALSKIWGQPVVIENQVGNNGVVATKAFLEKPADGYTLLECTFFHRVNPTMREGKMPYDTVKDLRLVGTFSRTDYVLLARKDLPANSVDELIALAKKNRGKLTFGSAGTGGGVHLTGLLFNEAAGITMLHVPYRGAADVNQDLMGGRIDVAFQTAQVATSALTTGKVKAFAVSSEKRLAGLPDLPTFKELGLDFEVKGWFGMLVSSKTPQAIVDKLSASIKQAMESPEVLARLKKLNTEPLITTADEAEALFKSDIERYGRVIRANDLKPGK